MEEVRGEDNPSKGRTATQVGKNTFETTKGNRPGVFVKTPQGGPANPEYPFNQWVAYKDLARYLNMPRVKLINSRGKIRETVINSADQYLVLQRVGGQRFDEALWQNPDKFSQAARVFVQDLAKMWQATKHKIVDSEVSDQISEAAKKPSVETIEAFLSSNKTQELLDLPVNINGKSYPSLRQLCHNCLERLQEESDPIVTYSHGDEHLGNLFTKETDGQITYQALDPRRGLYRRSPAAAINTFLGSTLLFTFDYQTKAEVKVDERGSKSLEIKYKVEDKYQEGVKRVLEIGKEMVLNLNKLNEGEFLTKEYLFANLIRGFIGRVDPRNLEKTERNKYASLALAIELYSDFDKFLNINKVDADPGLPS